MEKRVKKVRRLNIKALLVLLLIIYLIVMFLYTFLTMPIKNIYIKNTKLLTDNEIIEIAGLKKYPSIIKINTKKLEKKISSLELVTSVHIKKNLLGKLTIDIEEAKPLFYNRNTEKVVLSNGLEVNKSNKYLGIPTLVNYVPKDLLKEFISSFKDVNSDIISMINEILYDPDIKEEVTIDDKRFKLTMNDTNLVYVNVLNMERLNNYIEIYASISSAADGKKGTLYLDSYLSENNLFTPFDGNKDNKNDSKDENNKNTGDEENGED